MATPARPDRPLTVDEYLEWERRSPRKHEYVAGHVYAMSGVKIRHAQIVRNLAVRLAAATGDGPCQVLFNDVKLQAAHDKIYYPDAMVLCLSLDEDAYVVSDPCLVVEVLSPSTQRTDRGEKLDAYRAIPSLRAYLIVEQKERLVERHWRDASGEWQRETVTDLSADASVPVPCPGTTLALEEIYRGTNARRIDEPRRPGPRRVRERAPA
jgi:Uma2 family endonuclease